MKNYESFKENATFLNSRGCFRERNLIKIDRLQWIFHVEDGKCSSLSKFKDLFHSYIPGFHRLVIIEYSCIMKQIYKM